MSLPSPGLFRRRQFEPIIIVTCGVGTRGFFGLPELEKLMAERGLTVDHTAAFALGAGMMSRVEPAGERYFGPGLSETKSPSADRFRHA